MAILHEEVAMIPKSHEVLAASLERGGDAGSLFDRKGTVCTMILHIPKGVYLREGI
jgi:hypothetical protein